jgi:hypothetical protein
MPEHFRLGFGVMEEGFGTALQRIADHLTSLPVSAASTAQG